MKVPFKLPVVKSPLYLCPMVKNLRKQVRKLSVYWVRRPWRERYCGGLPHEEDNRYIADIQIKSIRKRYRKKERYKPHPDDRKYLPLIQQIIGERPTHGYRPVTLLVNRFLREKGESPVLNPSGSGHGQFVEVKLSA
jgi:hypothetical protein